MIEGSGSGAGSGSGHLTFGSGSRRPKRRIRIQDPQHWFVSEQWYILWWTRTVPTFTSLYSEIHVVGFFSYILYTVQFIWFSHLCVLIQFTKTLGATYSPGTGRDGGGGLLLPLQLLWPLSSDKCGGLALLGPLSAQLVRDLLAEGEDGLGEHQRHHAQVTRVPILRHLTAGDGIMRFVPTSNMVNAERWRI